MATVDQSSSALTSTAFDYDLASRLSACASQIVTRAQSLQWRGPDPYDGLFWSWPKVLTAGTRRRQAIVQLHARSPIDFRVLRRGPRPRLAKTLALFTRAALLLARDGDFDVMRAIAAESAQALHHDRAAGPDAWGYPFAVQTRWSYYPANSPNVVVTSFAIESLLLAAAKLGEPAFAERATRAGEWLYEKLHRARGHFAYHEHSDALIHNANLLAAAAARIALGDDSLIAPAVELTLDAQKPDGSFPYGEGEGLQFVDSFHTAYVLTSLMSLAHVDPAIEDAITRGARYWTEHFFDARGRALLWPDKPYPEDGHSTGTALSTLALLADIDVSFRPLLRSVAERTLSSMVEDGRGIHRRYRYGRTGVNYLRWCDGHIAAGVAATADQLSSQSSRGSHSASDA